MNWLKFIEDNKIQITWEKPYKLTSEDGEEYYCNVSVVLQRSDGGTAFNGRRSLLHALNEIKDFLKENKS